MDTATKHPVPDRLKLLCVIWELWRSGLNVRVPA